LAAASERPDLPDFTTSVEVDKIRLSKAKTWRRKDLFGQSLVDQAVKEMELVEDFQATAKRYAEVGAAQVTKEERANRRRALDDLGVPGSARLLDTTWNESYPKSCKSTLVSIAIKLADIVTWRARPFEQMI
jgi:hypothetical protein